ncbi:MAG: ABC transporter permease [Spirochaetaceae bacterium]|nr:ABC transporter permease [Spirochaetaceae bacterium]
MRAYIIRRLLLTFPTLFIVSFVIFAVIRFMPGDIVDAEISQMQEIGVSQASLEQARGELMKKYGLDVSIFAQYGRWIGVYPQADSRVSGLLQGDFGTSFRRHTPVLRDIAIRWPVTLELGLIAFIIANLVSIPIGVYSALRQDTISDYLVRSFAILCMAVPSFWLGTMIVVFPSLWWGYSPPIMYTKMTEDLFENLEMFFVPSVVLGLAMTGGTMRMTRTMMLEVLRQDYVRTAWAKGLRERAVVMRHALKNAFIPVITLIGYTLPVMIGGAVIIEQIFSLPGMGRLLIDATLTRDYTVISGIMLVFGLGMVLINLAVDLTYGILNPKVRP